MAVIESQNEAKLSNMYIKTWFMYSKSGINWIFCPPLSLPLRISGAEGGGIVPPVAMVAPPITQISWLSLLGATCENVNELTNQQATNELT